MRTIAAVLLLVVPLAVAAADEPEDAEEAPTLYTNEDLARFAEPGDPSDAGQAETGAEISLPDPLKEIEADQARRASRLARIRATESEISRLRDEIARLEKRALAVRNPYLPRPELSEAEEKAWEGLTAAERYERVQEQIADAREALEDAEARLEALRTKGDS